MTCVDCGKPIELPTPNPFQCKVCREGAPSDGGLQSEAVQAHAYLSRLLTACAPTCEPLPDLMGVCTQIDNLLAGLCKQELPDDGYGHGV